MAEMPTGDYGHIHRSIDQLRSMNERENRGLVGLGGLTDLRVHEYKPFNDLRQDRGTLGDLRASADLRLNDYNKHNTNLEDSGSNGDIRPDLRNDVDMQRTDDPKTYSAPSTPPTPLSITDAQMNDSKVRGRKRGGGGTNKPRDPLSWSPLDHSNSEIFGSKADLQLHTQIHMREAKPYKCSQCSKAFANSSYLSQHTRIHLGIKPYRCEICQRKFTQLSHLQQHIRTHTGDKPYKCRHPGCQKAFSQLSNLQSHSRCHQTDKPYKCNSCYKCFSDEPSLLEHIPKHKESKHLKTHICQYCGKSYTQETYLTKHMQKHAERTDKRPPITGLGLGLNRNLSMTPNTPLSVGAGDHPYWPKVSPDSAASLAEAMSQAQQHDFGQQHASVSDHHLQNHHRSLLEHHSRMNGDVVEDLAIRHNPNLGHLGVQNPPAPPSTPIVSSATNYDTSLTKTTTSSAFTPINSMNLGHHQLAQRSYLYDPISFQNKNGNQGGVTNSFPNQLISLHQIRNYAHQPAPGGLMSSDHLIGVGVGVGGIKDKGQ